MNDYFTFTWFICLDNHYDIIYGKGLLKEFLDPNISNSLNVYKTLPFIQCNHKPPHFISEIFKHQRTENNDANSINHPSQIDPYQI